MKKTFFALSILSCLMFSNCTSLQPVGCALESAVVSGVAGAIATQLQCSNPAQITSDIQKLVNGQSGGLCPAVAQTSNIGTAICDTIGTLAVSTLVAQLPTAWGCTATNAAGLLDGVIVNACDAVLSPPQPTPSPTPAPTPTVVPPPPAAHAHRHHRVLKNETVEQSMPNSPKPKADVE